MRRQRRRQRPAGRRPRRRRRQRRTSTASSGQTWMPLWTCPTLTWHLWSCPPACRRWPGCVGGGQWAACTCCTCMQHARLSSEPCQPLATLTVQPLPHTVLPATPRMLLLRAAEAAGHNVAPRPAAPQHPHHLTGRVQARQGLGVSQCLPACLPGVPREPCVPRTMRTGRIDGGPGVWWSRLNACMRPCQLNWLPCVVLGHYGLLVHL